MQECILEDGPEKENGAVEEVNKKDSKSRKASNGSAEKEEPATASLIFRVSHKVPYKTVLKGSSLYSNFSHHSFCL